MADSSVPITAGSGTNIDTRTATNGDHRQVVVLGNDGDNVAGVAAGGVGVNGGALSSTSGAIAASGTGTVGPLDVSVAGNVTFTVKNTTAGSAWGGAPVLVFEQSDDNVSWAPLFLVRSDTGQPGSTFILGPGGANGELQFDGAVEAVNYVRCRVTTGPTTNGLTVVIAAGGMPFPQANTLFAAPLDGHRPTAIACSNAFTPHTTGAATATQPFLILPNASTNVTLRVVRVRLELTIATAALLQLAFVKNFPPSTGGTSSAATGWYINRPPGPASSAFSVSAYTVAPTANSGMQIIGQRRAWVGVATAAGAPTVLELTFGANRPSGSLVIQPNSMFGVSWVAAPATAVSCNYEVEWTEEPA